MSCQAALEGEAGRSEGIICGGVVRWTRMDPRQPQVFGRGMRLAFSACLGLMGATCSRHACAPLASKRVERDVTGLGIPDRNEPAKKTQGRREPGATSHLTDFRFTILR